MAGGEESLGACHEGVSIVWKGSTGSSHESAIYGWEATDSWMVLASHEPRRDGACCGIRRTATGSGRHRGRTASTNAQPHGGRVGGTVRDAGQIKQSHTTQNIRDNINCRRRRSGRSFAEMSNQFGRSSPNGRVRPNVGAGMKYFMNRHLEVYVEYRFNDVYASTSSTAGLRGDYIASHVVRGLAWRFLTSRKKQWQR